MIGNVPRIGIPAFTILAPKPSPAQLRERTRAAQSPRAASSDAIEVGAEAIDTIRIENGIAKVGVDTGEKTIALEARLNGAISFSKGCYLGQETIERATARGGLKKRLFGLRFDGSRVAEIGAAVLLDGKEVGHVSSAALSPRMGAIGLAILHHSAWTPGTRLEIRSNQVGSRRQFRSGCQRPAVQVILVRADSVRVSASGVSQNGEYIRQALSVREVRH